MSFEPYLSTRALSRRGAGCITINKSGMSINRTLSRHLAIDGDFRVSLYFDRATNRVKLNIFNTHNKEQGMLKLVSARGLNQIFLSDRKRTFYEMFNICVPQVVEFEQIRIGKEDKCFATLIFPVEVNANKEQHWRNHARKENTEEDSTAAGSCT